MRITIGITHFNRSDLLGQLLSKIDNLVEGYDVLVVDDHSDEVHVVRVSEMIDRFGSRARLHQHDNNLGPGAAKNSLFEHSPHDYVYVLDSDNAVDMSTLQYFFNYALQNRPSVAATSSISYFTKPFKVRQISYQRPPCLANLETFMFGDETYNNGNMLINRKVWDEVGGYPVRHSLDTQGFGFRLRTHGYAYECVPGTTYFHRRHDDPSNSQFMQTSRSGIISIEQFMVLSERFSWLPRFIKNAIFDFPVLEKRLFSDSLFSHLRSTIDQVDCASYHENLNDELDEASDAVSQYLEGEIPADHPSLLSLPDQYRRLILALGPHYSHVSYARTDLATLTEQQTV